MESILTRHRKTWDNKKILRTIYGDWYRQIIADLKPSPQINVELGAGSGNFKLFKPDVVAADIEPHPWIDMAFDAHQMPFADNEVGNLVMVDVLHHLANPVMFLSEAARVLEKGGRLIMLEPFPSPFSLMVYRRFHPEPFIMDAEYFSMKKTKNKDPWDSNQAIPYLIFFKHISKFAGQFGDVFQIVKREKQSFLLYPASGGFENKSLIPDWSIPVFQGVEWLLQPLRDVLAFRCYIVLEKK